MLLRPDLAASGLVVTVHTELPETWPGAADPAGARGYVFQMREFIEAWLGSFGKRGRFRPLFVEIADADGPVVLLPLSIERRRGVSVLGFIDQGQADYNAPVLYPRVVERLGDLNEAFWDRLFAQLPHFDILRLEKMPGEVEALPNPLAGLFDRPHPQSCHGNNLDRPIKEIESVLLSPKEIRSKQRGLAKIAPVAFSVVRSGEEGRDLLEELIRHKQRRFEETRVPGYAENPDALAFLRAANLAFGRSGSALVCALIVGGEVTAAQWGLVQGSRFYALVTGFAAGKWTKFSCGRILNLELLHWLKANGFTYFDQGYGDERYKLASSDSTVSLFDRVRAQTARGHLQLAIERVRARLRASPHWEKLRQLKWVVRRRLWRSAIAGD